ncbi:MAG: PEGA domain-containing protein [Candidatus Aminicenantes bacterium]|jgi:tetratricopeptide (TPR) repeat protein
MIIKSSRSRFVSVLSIILFLVFTLNTGYPGSASSQESDAKRFYNEGIRSFENGEYDKAIDWFTKTLELTQDKQLQTDTYVYLSLVNFYMGDVYNAQNWIRKALDNDPRGQSPSRFPSEYIDLFNKTKSEYAKEAVGKQREAEEAKIQKTDKPEPRTVAVKEGKKDEGSKTKLILLIGGALIAGAVALLLLKPWSDDTGSIQVNSTPQGAKIYLDGTDTGKVTNSTLDNVEAGSHIVRLSLDDYEDYEETVTVTAGETAIVNVELVKNTIEVTSPTSNDTWQLGGNVTITWTTSGSSAAGIASRMNRGIVHMRQAVRLNRMRVVRSPSGVREINSRSRQARDSITGRNRQNRPESPSSMSSTGNRRIAENTSSGIKNPRNDSIDKRIVSTLHQKYKSLGKNQLLTVQNVKIELHQSGFGWRLTIAENTSNTGSYNWDVDLSLTPGSDYFVRIFSVSDPSVRGDSELFSIISATTANND